MADENETKIRDAVGPSGTESPAESPADVHDTSEVDSWINVDDEIEKTRLQLYGSLSSQAAEQIDWLIALRVHKAVEVLADRVQEALGSEAMSAELLSRAARAIIDKVPAGYGMTYQEALTYASAVLALVTPDEIDLYRALKHSGVRKRADIAKFVSGYVAGDRP